MVIFKTFLDVDPNPDDFRNLMVTLVEGYISGKIFMKIRYSFM